MKEDRRYHPTMMRLILSLIKSGRFRAFCRPSWHRNGRSNGRSNRQSDYCGHYGLTFGDEEEFLRQKTDLLLIIFWVGLKECRARHSVDTKAPRQPDVSSVWSNSLYLTNKGNKGRSTLFQNLITIKRASNKTTRKLTTFLQNKQHKDGHCQQSSDGAEKALEKQTSVDISSLKSGHDCFLCFDDMERIDVCYQIRITGSCST